MDSLVAQYTRPAHADEGQSHEEQLELIHPTPELSLKFALPPVAQVCTLCPHKHTIYALTASVSLTLIPAVIFMAPHNDRRLLKP